MFLSDQGKYVACERKKVGMTGFEPAALPTCRDALTGLHGMSKKVGGIFLPDVVFVFEVFERPLKFQTVCFTIKFPDKNERPGPFVSGKQRPVGQMVFKPLDIIA